MPNLRKKPRKLIVVKNIGRLDKELFTEILPNVPNKNREIKQLQWNNEEEINTFASQET